MRPGTERVPPLATLSDLTLLQRRTVWAKAELRPVTIETQGPPLPTLRAGAGQGWTLQKRFGGPRYVTLAFPGGQLSFGGTFTIL